jgi:hypothetical protein
MMTTNKHNQLYRLITERHRQIRSIVPHQLISYNERVPFLFLSVTASVFTERAII